MAKDLNEKERKDSQEFFKQEQTPLRLHEEILTNGSVSNELNSEDSDYGQNDEEDEQFFFNNKKQNEDLESHAILLNDPLDNNHEVKEKKSGMNIIFDLKNSNTLKLTEDFSI